MSVKRYRNNESGEVVACNLEDGKYSHVYMWEGCGATPKQITTDRFLSLYTPLPEAPEVEEWQTGEVELEDQYFWFVGQIINTPKNEVVNIPCMFFAGRDGEGWMHNGDSFNLDNFKGMWKLVRQEIAPPKPIVELLPHEFVEGQEVLVRGSTTGTWGRRTFHKLYFEGTPSYGTSMPTHRKCLDDEKGIFKFIYCIPYAENSHLEGQITDGAHGAVPKGYVPPNVPKLGESGYWEERDPVIDLSTNETYVIAGVDGNTYILSSGRDTLGVHTRSMNGVGFVRKIYHKGSYVREDETVHEHIPTRPHRIESCPTCDGIDDMESCAYCKDKG